MKKAREAGDAPAPVTPGQRIQQAREALGMSEAALADRLHITSQGVTKFEGAGVASFPKLPNALKIAKILGVDPWWIAFGQPPESPIYVELKDGSRATIDLRLSPSSSASISASQMIDQIEMALQGTFGSVGRVVRNETVPIRPVGTADGTKSHSRDPWPLLALLSAMIAPVARQAGWNTDILREHIPEAFDNLPGAQKQDATRNKRSHKGSRTG